MKLTEIFRGLILVSTFLYVVYLLLPFVPANWYSDSTLELLSFSGSDAILDIPVPIYHAISLAWLLTAVGMYFYIPIARSAFVWLYVITVPIDIVGGVVVTPGLDMAILSLSTLLDGAIIAIAYLTSVERLFVGDTQPSD